MDSAEVPTARLRAGDPALHLALSQLASDRKDSKAQEELFNWIGRRAAGLLWRRCRDLAFDDIVSAAMSTTCSKIGAGTLPIEGNPPGRADRAYINRIVQSRFQDARRARHRQAGDCGPSPVVLDSVLVDNAVRDLAGAGIWGDPEFAQRFPHASELLTIAGAVAIHGLEKLPPHLAQSCPTPKQHAELRKWVSEVFRLRAALRKGELAELTGESLRRVRKLLLGLDKLKEVVGTKPEAAKHEELEACDINESLKVLQSSGLLRRIALDGGTQGQSEAHQMRLLGEMLNLKTGEINVASLIGVDSEHADFVRLRDALYKRHHNVRLRIYKKLLWMQQRDIVSHEEASTVEGLLAFLKR